MNYAEYTNHIIKEFVNDRDNLKCDSITIDDGIKVVITPSNKVDASRIIGKKGHNISAIRTILRAVNNANGGGKLLVSVKDTFEE